MWAVMGSYSLLTLRAAEFGAVVLAAQNIVVRVFYFLCALADSLGQATQTFLPATIYPQLDRPSFRNVMLRLSCIAAVAAASGALLAMLVLSPAVTTWVAKDAGIVAQLQVTAPHLAASLFLHPFITITEGMVIAKREFSCIIKTYCVTLVLFGWLLKYSVGSLGGVWRTLVFWQISRFVNYWIHGAGNKSRLQMRID
jgi:Na+-driven multidrug efflux pump